uniref:BTB domain-containing protein n=1 Tax=Angiostrongylus cantonensis TaxID=6313 RepID=A0A0K0D475_ANGCA
MAAHSTSKGCSPQLVVDLSSLCYFSQLICSSRIKFVYLFKAFSSLNDLRLSGQLCDIVLVVEGRKINAHKVVLAASVPYFRIMFTTDMLEANQTEVVLQDLDFDTLEQLVSFAYSGELRISAGNVQSIMIGANFLQLDGVADKCAEYLQTRLHPSNALAIRAFCMALGCKSVVSAADRFVQKHFMSVSRSDEFLQLSIEEVVDLLSMDELYVESEEEVFEAALRWIQRDGDRRKKFASRILACVRLPLLQPSFLADEVAGHQLIRGDLACRDLVDEAKDYHLIPERRPYLRTFRTKIYAIGGFNGHDRLKIVESYDYNKNEWTPVAPLTKKRSALAAAFYNNKLYVCGGYDGITSLATVEVSNILTSLSLDKLQLLISYNLRRYYVFFFINVYREHSSRTLECFLYLTFQILFPLPFLTLQFDNLMSNISFAVISRKYLRL